MRKANVSFAFAFLLLPAAVFLSARAVTATRHTEPVPSDVQAPVAALLEKTGGVRATASGVTLDFWWSTGVQLGETGSGWAAVPEGALIGAVKVSANFRDIRGRIIKPGVYTLRFGIQPDNGDHLGVSPHRQFLLLSPAADDKEPGPLGHDAAVELSTGSVGGSHPGVLSIDPPGAAAQAVLSVHTTDLNHEALIVEVPTTRQGKPGDPLKFGIVLVGKIEA